MEHESHSLKSLITNDHLSQLWQDNNHPSEARIIIHNYKTILTPTDAYVSNRAE
jgi:hypothetical protein